MQFLRISLALVLALVLCSPAAAQETVNYASVTGIVTDTTSGVLPGAVVTARAVDTNLVTTSTTAKDGRFRFGYLKVGTYEISVQLTGFAQAMRRLTLNAGSAVELPVTLSVGAASTSVDVTASAQTLDTARSQIAGTVSQTEISAMPMNGRNFLDLALLIPGVSPTNNGGTQLFSETSAVPGTGISVGSQRNFSNSFMVDGLSANDDAAGFSGMPYGVDAVEQFQVVTSGGHAELGRALGGYVSVITRSGANLLHGSAYDFFRDDSLNAVNALSGTKLPLRQQQYGGSLGGPVKRDRTFYFANVEQRRLDQSGLTTIADANVATINARLQATGYPGSLISTGLYDNPVHSTNALAKVDHQASVRDQLSLRYSAYHVTSSNSRGAGALSAPSASAGLNNTDHAVAIGNTLMLNDSTILESRAQWTLGDLDAPPSDSQGPAVTISGVATFGTLSGSPTARRNTMWQLVNNLSHQSGAHALKAGLDVIYNSDRITFPRSIRGAYTFSSLANFLSGTYGNAGFTQTFGDPVVSQVNPNLGVYAQDEWHVATGLTLNLGVRYDLQWLETINTDTNNISPRLGFAWTPSWSSRTVVRGNAGIFFDHVPMRALANALLSAGNTTDLSALRQINVSLSPTQSGAPVFPKVLPAVVSTSALVNFTTMDRNLQNAYSRQASLEVEHQLGARTTISAAYQYMRGLKLIMQVNQNVPSCVAAGTNNGCRPISTYANNSQYSSVGESSYHGLHVSLVTRPATWAQLRVSYSLSKSMNDVGENFFNGPVDPFDPMKDWGRSDDDQRHRLVVSGSANRAGLQLSSTVQAYSALPFNITSGVTTVQGTAGRPIVDGAFIERNIGLGSNFFSWNARLVREFSLGGRAKLEAGIEGFNLTNHRNVLTRNTNFGTGAYPTSPSATFNQITAVGEPRSAQLSLRVRF